MADSKTEFVDGAFIHHAGNKMSVRWVVESDRVAFVDTIDPTAEKARRKWFDSLKATEGLPAGVTDADWPRFNDEIKRLHATALDARRIEKENRGKKQPDDGGGDDKPAPFVESKQCLADMPDDLVVAAKELLAANDLVDQIRGHLSRVIAGETPLALLCYLYGTSRLLQWPMNLIVTGASSSGKSFCLDQTSKFFPEETKIRVTDATENALFYMGERALEHRIVFGGERRRDQTDANADKTRPFRELISAGELHKYVPMKVGGEIQTVHIKRRGPIALSESTTVAEIDAEDANRCIVVNTDESQSQTLRILAASDKADETGGPEHDMAPVYQLHHAVQRLLERETVVIPFASAVTKIIGPVVAHNVEVRRAWPQCKAVVKASALLHQFQRERTANGDVVANLDDYELARGVLGTWMARIIHGGLSPAAANAFERGVAVFGTATAFSCPEAVKKRIAGESQLRRRYIPEWERFGLVAPAYGEQQTGPGRVSKRWQFTATEVPPVANTVLPPAADVMAVMAGHDPHPPAAPPAADEPAMPPNEPEAWIDETANADDLEMLF